MMPNYFEHKSNELSEMLSRNRFQLLAAMSAAAFLLWTFLAFGLSDETSERLFSMLPNALNTVVGIGVSVLITTFSFVFVALSLVSVQFSPRVVRHFWHADNFRRFFLWLFVFCFGFCFIIQFFNAPKMQLFGLVSAFYAIFIVFPVFLGYLADNLNAASIVNKISNVTVAKIEHSYRLLPAIKPQKKDVLQINSAGKGFLEQIDSERLTGIFLKIKQKYPQVSMRILNYSGSFIEDNSALVEITPNIEINPQTADEIVKCFTLSKFRSIDQDIEYGIRQLVDIGIKAISPAVNDPTTCVNCVHYLGVILKSLAMRSDKSEISCNLEKIGIYLKEPEFEKFLDDSFNQIYQWGKSDYVIVKTIINTLNNIMTAVSTEKRFKAILHEIDEMELTYIYDKTQNPTIELKEHQIYIAKALQNFYLTAYNQAEILNLSEEKEKLSLQIEKTE
jgi:uncharacterized membrane protein